MSLLIIGFGVVIAVGILVLVPKVPTAPLKAVVALGALLVILGAFFLASFRFVPDDRVGLVIRNVGGGPLPPGKIIATDGENGPQAATLPPGWHKWLWPIVYEIEYVPITEVPAGKVGVLSASDGRPLPRGAIYAPEWDADKVKLMAQDARYFLTEGGGHRGPQATVLTPGKYRINTKLFNVKMAPVTNIEKATVGVVKSNVGELPDGAQETPTDLVPYGERGIWRKPLLPQQYYQNPDALEVTVISTAERTVRYTKGASEGEEREIIVRSSDGFTFPVDVRIEYKIEAQNAPLVVARFGDDTDYLNERLNSAVRAIFRNNAESVKALDYVQQRSIQERQSVEMLAEAMAQVGVTVTAVRIGDVGDEQTLGPLLKTQTDREIAIQEQKTFQEQQRTAEQKKELTRTEQEAEEEKRLATARYEVQIAEQDKERRIIEAGAEAEAIQIKAQAQADAYRLISQQIGKGNAAMVELLKIVGERGIQITPRVMVVGDGGAGGTRDAETTALIGTMLRTMVDQDEASPTQASTGRTPAGTP